MHGFNEAIFDTLEMKMASMDDKDKCMALVFDEMLLKLPFVYNYGLQKTEGLKILVD